MMTSLCLVVYVFALYIALVKWSIVPKSNESENESYVLVRGEYKVSQTLSFCVNTHKSGLRRSSFLLKSYTPSKHTNWSVLLILAGDVEVNPGPIFKCNVCSKKVKTLDKALQCDDCDRWVHTHCGKVNSAEYKRLGQSDEPWYCPNCVATCGLCECNVLNSHKAVQCDSCNMWIHNSCSLLSDDEYGHMQSSACSWICPKCEVLNFSDSFFEELSCIKISNPFTNLRSNHSKHSSENQKSSQKVKSNRKIENLFFVQANVNGIRGKKLEVLSLLDTLKPDIVALQETKIDQTVNTAELFPSGCGYCVYRKDRSLNGGGVMLLVKENIDHMPMADLDNGSEAVWIRIKVKDTHHYIGSWYRPPDTDCEGFSLFEAQLRKIRSTHRTDKHPKIHLMGDFNFRNIDWSTGLNKNGGSLSQSDGMVLIDALNEHGLQQMVNFPTRGENCLDLFLTSMPGQIHNVHSPDKLSDHDVVACSLRICVPRKKVNPRKIYLLSKGNFKDMRSDALRFSREKFFNGHSGKRSLEDNWSMIKGFLSDMMSKHIPTKVCRSNNSLPWISNKIRRLIRRKNRTHAKAKKTGSQRLRSKWQSLRSSIQAEIKNSHDCYVNKMIGNIENDPKPFWKFITRQKKDSQGIPPLKVNDHIAQSDLEKAKALNNQFTSVFTKSNYDSVPLLVRSVPVMTDIKVTEPGVTKLLKNLNPAKASGPDEVHPRILKELANELGGVFAHLFQQSLDLGKVPTDWSLANICPLFKKGDRALPSNYRPVSLTSIPCKLLEHIVCSDIMAHMNKHKVISDRQHAFRKHHSCETQLCTVIDDWSHSLDKQNEIDVFIMDLEKAFDTPPHELLKAKLRSYGINSNVLCWIDSFLCSRKQCVVVNGTKSEWSEVGSGVPQGTVLGPILFSLYINDMVSVVKSQIRLFADDCVCYRTIGSDDDKVKLQADIDSLGKWARKWGMRFQPKKCNMMRLSRKKKTSATCSYTLEGTPLEVVKSVKYLGVTITNDLKWNTHVANICNKAYSTLGVLRRNLSSCPQNVKEKAFLGLVRPGLEYASSVWDPHNLGLQKELEKVQNRAARFVTADYSWDPGSMTGIISRLGWKSLRVRRKESRLILFYKGLKGQANVPVKNLVRLKPKGEMAHRHQFHVPFAKTDVHKFSFIPNTIRDWNSIPAQIISKADSATDPVACFSSNIKAN